MTSSPAAAGTRPNIVLIFCDDLGYGDLGCYGHRVHRTPRLDRMAAEGMRFTDFYVSAPVCSPSRASLLTGCYSQRVGLEAGDDFCVLLPGDPTGLSAEEVTLPALLRRQGYATRIVGKWHLGDQPAFLPTRHGFDGFFGLPYSNDMHPFHPHNERFHFPPLPLMRDEAVVEHEPDQAGLTERYTEDAIRFIRENRDRPFFLYFPHMYVHWPLYAPEEFLDASENAEYGAEVAHLDRSTGAILDVLAELGMDERTLVIFTSDNGGAPAFGGSNAPLRGWKNTTWEGGMREPCLVRWPGAVPAGSECRDLCTSMDLLPTLVRLAGGEPPSDRILDGHDIRDLLFGRPGARSPYEAFFYYKGRALEAVRGGPWKLHLAREELYHLEEDMGEENDRFRACPDVVRRLRDMAASCREDLGDGERPGRNVRPCGRVVQPQTLLPRS